jgi:hypothetical protein
LPMQAARHIIEPPLSPASGGPKHASKEID